MPLGSIIICSSNPKGHTSYVAQMHRTENIIDICLPPFSIVVGMGVIQDVPGASHLTMNDYFDIGVSAGTIAICGLLYDRISERHDYLLLANRLTNPCLLSLLKRHGGIYHNLSYNVRTFSCGQS